MLRVLFELAIFILIEESLFFYFHWALHRFFAIEILSFFIFVNHFSQINEKFGLITIIIMSNMGLETILELFYLTIVFSNVVYY